MTMKMEKLHLTTEWDKTFPKSDQVDHEKVEFVNRYGVTLAADLYRPKVIGDERLAAVAVSGPFGAVKEQSSGLYAQELAERGFLTIAFDPSFTGESGGFPRNVASPDINTEDFSAAVDYLSTRADVDLERVGILGICGWGGMAVNAAANDPRSLNSNNGWNVTSNLPFLNMPLLTYADEIENAVLLVHGEKAHSRYLSDSTFKKLKENDMADYEHYNKNYIIVPGASHTDLYDQKDKIPFDAIETFYREHLK